MDVESAILLDFSPTKQASRLRTNFSMVFEGAASLLNTTPLLTLSSPRTRHIGRTPRLPSFTTFTHQRSPLVDKAQTTDRPRGTASIATCLVDTGATCPLAGTVREAGFRGGVAAV